MGVFARLFRRSKTTEETGAAEAQTDGAAARPGTANRTGTQDAARAAEQKGSAGAPETAEAAVQETDRATGAGGVDIPKQQSSEAAGSEADEGART